MSFQLARYLATDISQRPEETKTNDIFLYFKHNTYWLRGYILQWVWIN